MIDFPKAIFGEDIIPTSDATKKYNCIAWSVSIDNAWIWPDENNSAWPVNLPREEHIENFKNFYKLFGFQECNDGAHEEGFEKIALYCDKDLVPCHASRTISGKLWTSKLGRGIDVSHKNLENLESEEYGSAKFFFKRPLNMRVKVPEMHDPRAKKVLMPWDNG